MQVVDPATGSVLIEQSASAEDVEVSWRLSPDGTLLERVDPSAADGLVEGPAAVHDYCYV